MCRWTLLLLTAFVMLGGCNDARKLDATNFTKVINQYLAKRGQECTFFAQTFPIDIPTSELKDQSGTAPQMTALERAGLVHGSNTTATIRGMMGSLGPSAPRSVKRYELAEEGKKYFQVKPGVFGQEAGLCYGHETVDSIVNWTEPAATGPNKESEVTYTYKIDDLAPWARQADVQRAFGDIRVTVAGISKAKQTIGLQLTDKGWEVAEQ